MKLKKDQQRYLSWISERGVAKGMTLGKGRPHDRRTVQSLVDLHLIKPVYRRDDVLQDEFLVRGNEDENGIAVYLCPILGDVQMSYGATHWGVPVKPFTEEDYDKDSDWSALQNGIDTACECYPNDEIRFEHMKWAIARMTLETNIDQQQQQ